MVRARAPLSQEVSPLTLRKWPTGVKIHQIAPNAVSGSYTFDMNSPCRTSLPIGLPPKRMAAQAAQPRPASDPGTRTTEGANTTSYTAKKLHRKSLSAAASPAGARGVSNPFAFGILKRATPPAITPSKEEPVAVGAPEPRPERRRSLGTTFSFLQSRHGRDRPISPSSPSSTTTRVSTRVSTSGSEDGSIAEPGSGVGSKTAPATRKEKRAQAEAGPTRHSAGTYFPTARSKPSSAPDHYSTGTTPVASVPPPSPTLAQPSYDRAQTKKVLRHARAELMKEVGKAGYNVLVVEGWVFSLALFSWTGRY